jgi:hypothetical protein
VLQIPFSSSPYAFFPLHTTSPFLQLVSPPNTKKPFALPRPGAVLGAFSILKEDNFPGMQSNKIAQTIPGASNFRCEIWSLHTCMCFAPCASSFPACPSFPPLSTPQFKYCQSAPLSCPSYNPPMSAIRMGALYMSATFCTHILHPYTARTCTHAHIKFPNMSPLKLCACKYWHLHVHTHNPHIWMFSFSAHSQ